MRAVRYGKNGDRVTISLSHDETLLLSAEEYARLGLREGDTLAREKLLELKRIEEIFRVRQKAVKLLEIRPLSAAGLKIRLRENLFSEEAIASVLGELAERGFLDDKKFAENWVTSRLKKKPVGRNMLLKGLLGKGVNRKEAERLLDSAYSIEDETAQCEKMLAKLLRQRTDDSRILLPALSRRGFSAAVIKRVYAEHKRKKAGD